VRTLKVVCGIAVLFMAVHMVHAIHHFHHMQREMSAGVFWGGMALAVFADVLSLIGGILLIIGK
jgi:hypothetical protein